MNLLSEVLKPDIALVSLALAGAGNSTSRYINLKEFRRALIVVGIHSAVGIKATEDVTIKCLEAKDGGGTDPQDLIKDMKVEGLVKSSIVVTDLTAGTGIDEGDTITINDVTFTCAATTEEDDLKFADGDGLVSCIEAHLPNLAASNSAGVVTISAAETGFATITLTETADGGSSWTPGGYTTHAMAYVEVSASQITPGFSHIAVNVANGAAADINAVAFVVRGDPYSAPVYQAVAAYGLV